MATKQNLENNRSEPKRQAFTVFALYSEDDGVVLFDTEADAEKTKAEWDEAGANGLAGPFGPFTL